MLRHGERGRAVAAGEGAVDREVHVVAVQIEAIVGGDRARLRVEGAVGGDRGDVDRRRVAIAADAVISVRRHVDEVARRRRDPAEPVGMRHGEMLAVDPVGEVDVIMDRAAMIGIAGEDALEEALRAASRPAADVAPAPGDHPRVGGHDLDRVVLRHAQRRRFHVGGIGLAREGVAVAGAQRHGRGRGSGRAG